MNKAGIELIKQKKYVLVGFILFFILFFKNAWVGDDAYIIFRSVEQLFAGNGPIWNPHERVQVFTSPLWFFVLAVSRIVSPDLYFNTITISLLLSILLLFLLVKLFHQNVRFLFVVLLLSCSNGFFDFVTSGLENILGYFLIGLFVSNYHKLFSCDAINADTAKCIINRIFVTYGLVMLTRHDLSLLLFPALLYLFLTHMQILSSRTWVLVFCKSFFLFVCWSFFSLLYYGTIFPNTAFAKLNTGIDKLSLMKQGALYFYASMRYDSMTIIVIFLGLSASFITRKKYLKSMGYCILINLAYVVYIGGDFMQGRFLSYAYLVSLLTFVLSFDAKKTGSRLDNISPKIKVNGTTIIISLIFLFQIFYPHTPFNSPFTYSNKNIYLDIADERGYYFDKSSLLQYVIYLVQDDKEGYFPVHEKSKKGYEFSQSAQKAAISYTTGFFGYWAGIDKIIFDPLALSDPFLARLSLHREKWWRIGHFMRDIPPGYLESVRTGEFKLGNPDLNEFYKKIVIITQGKKLFSLKRLKTIILMNFGKYDHYLEDYKKSLS